MAPEMDQFYRSTMAIYKVSMCVARAPGPSTPSQGRKVGPGLGDRVSMTAACSGRKALNRPGLWAQGWGSPGAVNHPRPA